MPEQDNAPKAGTNFLTIPWPQDAQGALKDIKAGGVASARRIKGDKERLDKYLQTLRLLGQHALACFERDEAQRAERVENAVNAQRRIQERLNRQYEARAEQYEAAAARVRDQVVEVEPEGETPVEPEPAPVDPVPAPVPAPSEGDE